MREGILFYDRESDRFDVRFSDRPYTTYGGIHCGHCLQILLNDNWIDTRMEMKHTTEDGRVVGKWYLVGIKEDLYRLELDEPKVRI